MNNTLWWILQNVDVNLHNLDVSYFLGGEGDHKNTVD